MYALDKKRIIEVAKVNRDLRREGGSDPVIKVGILLKLKSLYPITGNQAGSDFASWLCNKSGKNSKS